MKKNILIGLIIFILDRISKQIVISTMKIEKSIVIIKNFFSITLAKNTGVAFSLLDGKIDIIIILSIPILLFLINMIKKNNRKEEIICYYLILGGALGNLFDRIIFGYVIDFLDFNIFGYHYPTFNIADSSIVIGVILLLIISIKKEGEDNEFNSRKRKNKNW